jgi:hypothetical protein
VEVEVDLKLLVVIMVLVVPVVVEEQALDQEVLIKETELLQQLTLAVVQVVHQEEIQDLMIAK